MKIITLEGLKGCGKSTLLEIILRRNNIEKFEKFTKGCEKQQDFLIDFSKRYSKFFTNMDSSLALKYYANFFSRLKRIREEKVIIDRGILSLPYFGFYGYANSEEKLKFCDYEQVVIELYEAALNEYKRFEDFSSFFIIECGRDEIKKRLLTRRKLIPSESFFIENLEIYEELKKKTEKIAKEKLNNSRFFNMNNEKQEDLEIIISKVEEDLASKA